MVTSEAATKLIEAARALRPRIVAARDHIEAGRRLPAELTKDLARAGFFRLFLPAVYGGLDLTPLEALEPVAAGTSFVDEDELLPLRLQMPKQLINIALPGPDGAEGDHLGTMLLGHRGDRNGLCMDIHSNVERARLCHG